MKAFGYEVTTKSAEVLEDITEIVNSENMWIRWENFKTGDFYWTGNGERYTVKINHENKTVEITEE